VTEQDVEKNRQAAYAAFLSAMAAGSVLYSMRMGYGIDFTLAAANLLVGLTLILLFRAGVAAKHRVWVSDE